MKAAYLVRVSDTPVRVCVSEETAKRYVQCMLEEIDEATGEPMFEEYEFCITPIPYDEK